MRKVAIALLRRCCHALTLKTDPAPFIRSSSLATLTEGKVCTVSALETNKVRKKRAANKSVCSRQDLGGSERPFHAEVAAEVTAKASWKVRSDACAQDLGFVVTRKEKTQLTSSDAIWKVRPDACAQDLGFVVTRKEKTQLTSSDAIWKVRSDACAQDLGFVVTRKEKTQLTSSDAIYPNDSEKAGPNLGKTEDLALSTETTLEKSSEQTPFTEIMAKVDLNTYRWGKQWEEASQKLLDYGIPPMCVVGMLGKCRKLTCSVHCVDSTLNHLSLLGMSHAHIGRIISRWPTILNTTDRMFRRKLEFLESIGVDKCIFGKGRVAVFLCSFLILRQNAALLKDHMAEVHTNAVPIMMSKDPEVLVYNIRSKLAWLESQEFEKKWLLTHSRILHSSIQALTSNAEMLGRFGISDVRKRARALCAVCGLKTSKLQARYNNVLAAGFSCNQLGTVLSNYPTVLGLREERVNAKLNFAVQVMNTPRKEIVSATAFWGVSLERRMKPRYEVVKELLMVGARECGLSLAYLISMSDSDFHRRFVERYEYVWKHGKGLKA